jgi:hypothetical protein
VDPLPTLYKKEFIHAWSNAQIRGWASERKGIPCVCYWDRHEEYRTRCCEDTRILWIPLKRGSDEWSEPKRRTTKNADKTYGVVVPTDGWNPTCDCPNPDTGFRRWPYGPSRPIPGELPVPDQIERP